MSTTENQHFPIAAHRWMSSGEAWTYHPRLATPEGGLDPNLICELDRAGEFRAPESDSSRDFLIPLDERRMLLGSVTDDAQLCGDPKARGRRPYLLRFAVVDSQVTPDDVSRIREGLQLYVPSVPGPDPRAIVAIKNTAAINAESGRRPFIRASTCAMATVLSVFVFSLIIVGAARPGLFPEGLIRPLFGSKTDSHDALHEIAQLREDAGRDQVVIALNSRLDPFFYEPAAKEPRHARTAILSRLREVFHWQKRPDAPETLDQMFERDKAVALVVKQLLDSDTVHCKWC